MIMVNFKIFFREVNPLTIAGRMALEDAKQRHDEIIELEDSLLKLQEIFDDMYLLVHSQVVLGIAKYL